MTKFLLAAAGLALSIHSAVAGMPHCSEFFSDIDVQRQCVRFERITKDEASALLHTCEALKAIMVDHLPYQLFSAYDLSSSKDLNACKNIRDVIEPNLRPPSPRNVIQPTPQPSASPYEKGVAALEEGNFDVAITEFGRVIADDPKNAFAYIRRGTAYEKKGDAASAISDYRKVLKLVDADTGAEYAAKIRN
ncbi:hypothetical protein IVA96_30315 [Bradyrhizobium sp. 159]|uniref:tetratricopeptide repeat protein n=1 Tax=Bradyrhizobium sp. 159 TaxID=2782632 RepID=UPI001FFAA4F4|nr:tetratricopeptide repeat protein [Bradyrhizobium sp. 159]MCK1620791.1 hypothetical protein [Bradyrhizobium sp. 159]